MSQKTNTELGFAAMMVAVVVILVSIIHTAMDSALSGHGSADMSAAAVEARIKPVAQLNTGAPIAVAAAPAAAAPAASSGARTGEQVFHAVCFACHGTGAAGAPKVGDKAAWGPRIAQGISTLLKHAENGFQGKTGVMPPRGTCGNCSNDELKGAIEYMVSQSK